MKYNYPQKHAYMLAQQLKRLRAKSEEYVHSEINPLADQQMRELVRVIDWSAFDSLVKQMELLYKTTKEKRKTARS